MCSKMNFPANTDSEIQRRICGEVFAQLASDISYCLCVLWSSKLLLAFRQSDNLII